MRYFIVFLLICFAWANESSKGYIDMHGGKGDKLIDKRSNFSTTSPFSQSSLSSKPLEKKDKTQPSEKNTPSK